MGFPCAVSCFFFSVFTDFPPVSKAVWFQKSLCGFYRNFSGFSSFAVKVFSQIQQRGLSNHEFDCRVNTSEGSNPIN